MDTVIEFKDFYFKYSNQKEPSLKNINLKIKKGEKILIAGSSGSGKSTLGCCLNGIIPFSKSGSFKGSLNICGITPYKTNIFEISNHVGTVLQDQDGQFIGLSVGEDVSFIDENNCVSKNKMIENTKKALKAVRMFDFIDSTPQELSGGQKQSVSLAGIMCSSADILLFDEPLANLDPKSGKNAIKLISDIQKQTEKTIIVIEHRIEDVLECNFDRVIILNNGEIAEDNSPENLFKINAFKKYGLREPLYIEALKYAGIENLSYNSLYEKKNIDRILNWCNSIKISKKNKTEVILELKNINFAYNEKKEILKDISFNLKKGEILALLGNNGAGKSTLCKIITGIEKEKNGDILYFTSSLKDMSIKKRGENIGYVMQNPNHMIIKETLLEEIEFGLKLRNIKNTTEIADKVLKICGLFHARHWPISALSYGQKKRVTIASILALNPKILILDEPTAGQDYQHYKEFMKFIKSLANNGVAIILITHDMHLALEYCDRAIVLCEGKILADDTPAKILSKSYLMEKSNLEETSLSKMAKIIGISPNLLMESFINFENKREEI